MGRARALRAHPSSRAVLRPLAERSDRACLESGIRKKTKKKGVGEILALTGRALPNVRRCCSRTARPIRERVGVEAPARDSGGTSGDGGTGTAGSASNTARSGSSTTGGGGATGAGGGSRRRERAARERRVVAGPARARSEGRARLVPGTRPTPETACVDRRFFMACRCEAPKNRLSAATAVSRCLTVTTTATGLRCNRKRWGSTERRRRPHSNGTFIRCFRPTARHLTASDVQIAEQHRGTGLRRAHDGSRAAAPAEVRARRGPVDRRPAVRARSLVWHSCLRACAQTHLAEAKRLDAQCSFALWSEDSTHLASASLLDRLRRPDRSPQAISPARPSCRYSWLAIHES